MRGDPIENIEIQNLKILSYLSKLNSLVDSYTETNASFLVQKQL